MNTAEKAEDFKNEEDEKINREKHALASSLSSLGRLHNGEYVISQHCQESIKDIMRALRKDTARYSIRRYLGEAKVVQNDLIHIVKACSAESEELFDLTIRLLTALTTSVVVLYGEEIPAEKIGRNIYMNLIEHLQDYKEAFYDIDFWNVICGKLTDYFEIDWTERSESQCIKIEKLLILLRNVLHIPADPEREKITENDISVHDKILWSLRQSQILEFLLYVSSNKNESRHHLHMLEIFSLILREQNPKLLAMSEVQRSMHEREKDMKDLMALREREKVDKNKYKHTRTFDSTLVLEGVKSFSGRDMIYHGSLEDMKKSVVAKNKKRGKPRNYKLPVQSEQIERKSSFSVRIFLKEFCIEFLNCSYNNLMSGVKEKLVSGKCLPDDEILYFWALKFFHEFNCAYNLDIKLISHSVNVQTFHYLQTYMDENFERLLTEKKKRVIWVRKLHFILKAYYSLLQTLKWMDSSKDASVREMSKVLKSQVFYVAEYRDMALSFLTRYEPDLFSVPYLRDMIEATHLSMKLLEDYSKHNKIVVRKKIKKRSGKKRKKTRRVQPEPVYESNEEKWSRIKGDVEKVLSEVVEFPDIAPFDVMLDLTDDEQKERAMKKVQRLLHEEKVLDGIGLLRSARKAWPENDHFGSEDMSVEEEVKALEEICLAELGNERVPVNGVTVEEEEEEGGEDEEDEDEGVVSGDEETSYRVSEESFDMMSYKKQLVNKKVVEACAVLLQNYSKNSDYTNHCIIKILFRIGWECDMPAMMYQASLFWTLLTIMNDKYRVYKEINDFTVHLVRKFREDATRNKFTFVDLLFWKDPTVALEIQDRSDRAYDSDEGVKKTGKKVASWSVEEEDEVQRLWHECNPEYSTSRKVEWVRDNLIDQSKSLIGVKRKLRELGLVSDSIRAARLNSGKDWEQAEVEELTKLFKESKGAVDIVTVISGRLTVKRTKKSIRQKLLEIGLVKSLSQLRKKKGSGRIRDGDDFGASSQSESSESDDEGEQHVQVYSLEEQEAALKGAEHMKPALEWLRDTVQECINEDDEVTDGYPVLAMETTEIEALETAEFINVMRKLGFQEPVDGQVYWKIPKKNKRHLEDITNLLNSAISGELPKNDVSGSEDEFEKLKNMRQNMLKSDSAESQTRKRVKKKTPTASRRRSNKSKKNGSMRVESDEEGQLDVNLVDNAGQSPVPLRDEPNSDGEETSRSHRRARLIESDSDSDLELGKKPTAQARDLDREFDQLIGSTTTAVDERETGGLPSGGNQRGRLTSESDRSIEDAVAVPKNPKRRRCISSDSDGEEGGSVLNDEKRRKVKVFGSDSDLESDNRST